MMGRVWLRTWVRGMWGAALLVGAGCGAANTPNGTVAASGDAFDQDASTDVAPGRVLPGPLSLEPSRLFSTQTEGIGHLDLAALRNSVHWPQLRSWIDALAPRETHPLINAVGDIWVVVGREADLLDTQGDRWPAGVVVVLTGGGLREQSPLVVFPQDAVRVIDLEAAQSHPTEEEPLSRVVGVLGDVWIIGLPSDVYAAAERAHSGTILRQRAPALNDLRSRAREDQAPFSLWMRDNALLREVWARSVLGDGDVSAVQDGSLWADFADDIEASSVFRFDSVQGAQATAAQMEERRSEMASSTTVRVLGFDELVGAVRVGQQNDMVTIGFGLPEARAAYWLQRIATLVGLVVGEGQ